MLVMTPKINRHLPPEDIERYSLGELPEELTDSFEEHLLLCESCRDQVQEHDDFVRSMQLAGNQIRNAAAAHRPEGRARHWVFLLAAASLVAMAVLLAWMRGSARPEFAVNLSAMRGAPATATAPANTPLALYPDLSGLPPAPSYRMEVVDASGRAVWSGTSAAATLPARRTGMYFVRVYSGRRELLREYALQVH
jgi:Putative zinc-finger